MPLKDSALSMKTSSTLARYKLARSSSNNLTDKVNSTLYSINQIPSDDPDFQDHILENQIGMINAIRCNQLMTAIGAFWNNTANILSDFLGQIQDLSGPLFCEKFDPDTDSYSIG